MTTVGDGTMAGMPVIGDGTWAGDGIPGTVLLTTDGATTLTPITVTDTVDGTITILTDTATTITTTAMRITMAEDHRVTETLLTIREETIITTEPAREAIRGAILPEAMEPATLLTTRHATTTFAHSPIAAPANTMRRQEATVTTT